MTLLEKIACKFLIWRFKVGYGADCPESDLLNKDEVLSDSRCASCRAEETIDFLKKHIELC